MSTGPSAGSPDDLLTRGNAALAAGDMATARATFGEALSRAPTLDAILGYVSAAWTVDPDACLKLLRATTATEPRTRLMLAGNRLMYQELFERARRGLMQYHSHSIDDVLFRFASDEHRACLDAAHATGQDEDRSLAEFSIGNVGPLSQLSESRFNAGERTIWSAIRLTAEQNARFVGNADEIDSAFPEVMTERKVALSGPVVWLSCSGSYLAFALPMLESLKDVAPAVATHLHVMDPKTLPDLPHDTGLSWEQAHGDRNYYHAVRFVRFWQWLRANGREAWLMDVDALFNRSPESLFGRLETADIVFRARPARIEPWNQLSAGIVGASPRERCLSFLGHVAAYLAHFRRHGGLAWGIDQMAMLAAYRRITPTVSCLDEREMDMEYRDDGIVWCNASARKFLHLKGVSDPERQKYVDRFRQYASRHQ